MKDLTKALDATLLLLLQKFLVIMQQLKVMHGVMYFVIKLIYNSVFYFILTPINSLGFVQVVNFSPS